MHLRVLSIVALLIVAGLQSRAGTPGSPSYLTKIFGLEWSMKKEEALQKFSKEPGVRREKDNRRGYSQFQGGKFFGKPVKGSYLSFYDDKLMWMDTNFPAPGDPVLLYQELSKKIEAVLGPTDGVQTGKRGSRTRIWKTTSGGPSGMGETVKLAVVENEPWINLRVEDPKYSK